MRSLLIVGHAKGFSSPVWRFTTRALSLSAPEATDGEALNPDRGGAMEGVGFYEPAGNEAAYRRAAEVLDAHRGGYLIKDVIQPYLVHRYVCDHPDTFNVLYVNRDPSEALRCQQRMKDQGWADWQRELHVAPLDDLFGCRGLCCVEVDYYWLCWEPRQLWMALYRLGYDPEPFNYCTTEFSRKRAEVWKRLNQQRTEATP